MAGKLTDEHMDQLESWIGTGPKKFTPLYSIARDGCVASTFHQKCDNQGPTVTVLYNQQGSVYGGYTSTSWNSSGTRWVKDDKAFLYQLQFSGNNNYNKFPCTKNPQYAIDTTSDYGPTFGGGYDLRTFNGTVDSSGGYFALNGCINNWGYSYDTQGVTADKVNNGNMNVTELEVYKVTDGTRQKVQVQPQTLPQKPWRKTPELNQKYLAKLMEEMENVKPMSDVDITEFRILMLGPVGSGKSSFYNTIDSIFRGRISHRATCGNESTTAYSPYDVRTKSGSVLKLRLCDTPGFGEHLGSDVFDYNYLIDGHLPDFYEFNLTNAITLQSPEFVHDPTSNDKMHCVVFVLDASTVSSMSTKQIEKIQFLRKMVNQRKLPQAFILTNIDKVSKDINETVASVFVCKQVETAVEKVASMFNLPRNSIFPVKNYEHELHLDDGVSTLALMALQQLLYLAEDYTHNLAAKAKRGLKLSQTRGSSTQEVTESDTA